MIPLTTIVNSHFLQSDQNINTRNEDNLLFNSKNYLLNFLTKNLGRRRRLGNILNYFTIDHLHTLRNVSRLGNRSNISANNYFIS